MTQIFKTKIPSESLYSLLDGICIQKEDKEETYYVFDKNAYKKGIFTESIQIFLANCKKHYFLSKQKYVERKQTYNSFTTIIRQICNHNNITYKSEIKYDKSTYNIIYYIQKMMHGEDEQDNSSHDKLINT
jgi:hypothetical protein